MRLGIRSWLGLVFLVSVMLFSHEMMRRDYSLPYPRFNKLLIERKGLRDLTGILLGLRGTIADMAWIDFIQYVGGGILPDEDTSRNYDLLQYFAQRVIRIDPFYHAAVLYGSGMLAWFRNVNRPDEALELLREGVKNDPDYWPYHMYIAAIMYKKSMNYEEALNTLEESIKNPNCPVMIKSMLAHIYKDQKRYADAIRVWVDLLNGDDEYYHETASKQIEIIKQLIK